MGGELEWRLPRPSQRRCPYCQYWSHEISPGWCCHLSNIKFTFRQQRRWCCFQIGLSLVAAFMFYHCLNKAPDSMSVIMCHNDTACVNNLVMSSWCRAVCIGRCPMSHAVATVCIIRTGCPDVLQLRLSCPGAGCVCGRHSGCQCCSRPTWRRLWPAAVS